MTPEGAVKGAIKELLKLYGAYYFMPVQYGYGAAAVDFLICHRGRFGAIEAKAPGKKPTARQRLVLEDVAQAKGATFVIDSVNDLGPLEKWLRGTV